MVCMTCYKVITAIEFIRKATQKYIIFNGKLQKTIETTLSDQITKMALPPAWSCRS